MRILFKDISSAFNAVNTQTHFCSASKDYSQRHTGFMSSKLCKATLFLILGHLATHPLLHIHRGNHLQQQQTVKYADDMTLVVRLTDQYSLYICRQYVDTRGAFPLQELGGHFRLADTFRRFSTVGTVPVGPLSGPFLRVK